jgi:hypothetical protein
MSMQTKIGLAENNQSERDALKEMLSKDIVTATLPYALWREKCANMEDPICVVTYRDDDPDLIIEWIEVDCTLWYAMEMVQRVGAKSILVDVAVEEE